MNLLVLVHKVVDNLSPAVRQVNHILAWQRFFSSILVDKALHCIFLCGTKVNLFGNIYREGRFAELSKSVGLWSNKFGLSVPGDKIQKFAALVLLGEPIWRLEISEGPILRLGTSEITISRLELSEGPILRLETSEAAWPSGLRRWF